ncbi:hypothetical protein L6Q96_15450 [Candidatus Binatia bacterium]|nr:hypothetical protein [Candidatus Binatia bacterium]
MGQPPQPPTCLPVDIAGAHDIDRDAGFEFPGGGDFSLRPGSPALDAGDILPRETFAPGNVSVSPWASH